MECLRPLPGPGPKQREANEKIEKNETELFCAGPCRGLHFGKRNGASLRRQLFELEKGVCQGCGLDCHGLFQALRCKKSSEKDWLLKELLGLAAARPSLRPLLDQLASRPSGLTLTEGLLWQADHVLPVWQGGGTCGLDNLQTLCAACHSKKTQKEATLRAVLRNRARASVARARRVQSQGDSKRVWPSLRLGDSQAAMQIDLSDDENSSGGAGANRVQYHALAEGPDAERIEQ